MGFFGAYIFDSGNWAEVGPDSDANVVEPWLFVNIHDSDVATVMYGPVGPGSGTAFLGWTPRTYFEDDSASAPTDVTREAEGLAAWWAAYHGGASQAAQTAKVDELRQFLVGDNQKPHEDVPDYE